MRVLLVLGTSTGGVGAHVRSLAAGLVAAGDRVVVAGPAATQDLFDFTGAGARFEPVAVSTGPRPLADARAVARLRRSAAGADVVHAHGLRAGFLSVAAVRRPVPPGFRSVPGARRPDHSGSAGRGRRMPVLVVTWHNALLGTGPARRLLALLELVTARRADVVLGASGDLTARATDLGAADARTAAVAAPRRPAATRSPTEVRAELGVAADAPLLLAVGRLAPQKNYPLLLDAAAGWRDRSPRPVVLVAGDGPLQDSLEERIRAEDLPVRLLGRRTDVADLLAAADVVVLTSVWEARALVAQEALAAGVPLVATAVGGVPELVGDAAVLVPAGDAPALAAAVAGLLDDPAALAGLRAAGPLRAADWPDAEAVVAGLRDLYAALVARRGVAHGC